MELYKKGSRGEIVKKIQRVVGCYPDGVYGDLTTESVKAWQQQHGLTADGIVGPATLAKMIPSSFKRSKRTIREIIIHCSATPEGKDYTVTDIRRWHKQQGWSDIGYHYVVYRNGHVEPGRDVDISGAHCQGHNSHSIGICYVGGMDRSNKKSKDTRTLQQKAAMLNLLNDLRKLYPEALIYGHHNFDNGKDCPCFDARSEYASI